MSAITSCSPFCVASSYHHLSISQDSGYHVKSPTARGWPPSAGVAVCRDHHPALTSLRNNSNRGGEHLSSADVRKTIDNISQQFSEAMELLNDARSSTGTVYFSEDMEDAQTQVADTLKCYNTLLGKLNEEQRKNVIRSVGLRMEELKSRCHYLRNWPRNEN
ncbi:hypothetical protein GWK47_017200 [Chionoecetes opilio]|uniref:Uncharacterized protein n=1 Tax=Chionoecetes opilio TaxID=41210 RepID=A0A8J4XTY9_CHIOP|nr:hypothetical protein GWK47_017200 [Chionoecetes opilio]